MSSIIVRYLGLCSYEPVWQEMKNFVNQKIVAEDEFWVLQHKAVFTQGQAGKPEHLLDPGNIPLVKSDRGGQITYHGPGQIIIYLLCNIKQKKLGVRSFVEKIETAIVNTLFDFGIFSEANSEAHGVYVEGKKIASIGLRIRHGCSYHGLSLNVDMGLEPFKRINPCGLQGMQMVQVIDFKPKLKIKEVERCLVDQLCTVLNYDGIIERENESV